MTVTENPIRNGVDTATLFATLDAVKEAPAAAKFQFRAHNEWQNGTHSRSTIGEAAAPSAQPQHGQRSRLSFLPPQKRRDVERRRELGRGIRRERAHRIGACRDAARHGRRRHRRQIEHRLPRDREARHRERGGRRLRTVGAHPRLIGVRGDFRHPTSKVRTSDAPKTAHRGDDQCAQARDRRGGQPAVIPA